MHISGRDIGDMSVIVLWWDNRGFINRRRIRLKCVRAKGWPLMVGSTWNCVWSCIIHNGWSSTFKLQCFLSIGPCATSAFRTSKWCRWCTASSTATIGIRWVRSLRVIIYQYKINYKTIPNIKIVLSCSKKYNTGVKYIQLSFI